VYNDGWVYGTLPFSAMGYMPCYVLYGDLIERTLDRSTEVVFIFCAVANINLKN